MRDPHIRENVKAAVSRASILVRSNMSRSIPVLVACFVCAAFIALSSFSMMDSKPISRRVKGRAVIGVGEADVPQRNGRKLGPDPFTPMSDEEEGDAEENDSLKRPPGPMNAVLDSEGAFPQVDEHIAPVLLSPYSAHQLTRLFSPAATAAWWAGAPGGSASVCVIVRTFIGQRAALPALLSSLLASGHPALTVFLADTGSGAPCGADLAAIASTFYVLGGRRAVVVTLRTRANVRPLFPRLQVCTHWSCAYPWRESVCQHPWGASVSSWMVGMTGSVWW